MGNRIEVMIERGNETLLTKDGKQYGLPGGDIKPTQTAFDAAIVNCLEELGIRITNIRLNIHTWYTLTKKEEETSRKDNNGGTTIVARAYFGEWDGCILGDKLEFEWVPTVDVKAKLEASDEHVFNARRLETLGRLDENGTTTMARTILKEGMPYAEYHVFNDSISCVTILGEDVFKPIAGLDVSDIQSWDTLVTNDSIHIQPTDSVAFVRYPLVGAHDIMVIREGKFVK